MTGVQIHKVLLFEGIDLQLGRFSMGLLGTVAEAILIYTCVIWILGIVGLYVMGQTLFGTIAAVWFIVPFYMVISEKRKTKARERRVRLTETFRSDRERGHVVPRRWECAPDLRLFNR